MASVAVDPPASQRARTESPEKRNAPAPEMKNLEPLSAWDVTFSVNMAIASVISYWIVTHALSGLVDSATHYPGGMRATVATIFVFRDTRTAIFSAGLQRFMATCVSFVLCQIYFLIFPFEAENPRQ
jgi:hypothetical protein